MREHLQKGLSDPLCLIAWQGNGIWVTGHIIKHGKDISFLFRKLVTMSRQHLWQLPEKESRLLACFEVALDQPNVLGQSSGKCYRILQNEWRRIAHPVNKIPGALDLSSCWFPDDQLELPRAPSSKRTSAVRLAQHFFDGSLHLLKKIPFIRINSILPDLAVTLLPTLSKQRYSLS